MHYLNSRPRRRGLQRVRGSRHRRLAACWDRVADLPAARWWWLPAPVPEIACPVLYRLPSCNAHGIFSFSAVSVPVRRSCVKVALSIFIVSWSMIIGELDEHVVRIRQRVLAVT